MIIAIDIGNTTTGFGVFEAGKLVSQFAIGTQRNRTPDELTLELKALAKGRKLHLRRVRQIMLCSVVPRMTGTLLESLRQLDAVPVKVVGQEVHVPIVNKYKYPEQVGQDRLVGAYAAWQKFKSDCIVCDFGTAITIDLVTKAGEYLGGIIAPGMEISLEALAARTALLPKVELKEPPELLGRQTADSIRSGILHGCAALCDGLVARLKRQYAPKAAVIATGGASRLMRGRSAAIEHYEPTLVLDGLFRLCQRVEKKKK